MWDAGGGRSRSPSGRGGRCTFDALETHATGTIDLRGFAGTADVSPHFQELTLTLALTTDVPEAELDELKARVLRRCPLVNLIKDAGVAIRDVWVVRPTA
ncbi:hypothetical protein [Georgenia wangjunii]|uniref:hypothetical protein n=1 Tax=Georgenia wangjunii TaxID=3117730 RepID=UPI002F25FF14